MPEQFTITGQIRYSDEQLGAEVTVQAFDKDLPSLERRTGSGPQELGSAITDREGRFTIHYTEEQFRRGEASSSALRRSRRQSPDLIFRVSNPQGQELRIAAITANDIELPPPQILFNAPADTHIFIMVEPHAGVTDSEYEQLLAQLAPVLEDVPLAELTGEDIVFLAGDTGRERRHLEYIRGAAQLSHETDVPTEAFYGWARHDPPLPEEWRRLLDVSDGDERREVLTALLRRLIAADEAELRRTLQRQIEERIIPARIREQIDDIIKRLKQHGQIMHRAVGQLRDQETGEPLANLTVRVLDLDAGNTPEDLGAEITNGQGLFAMTFPAPVTPGPEAERRLLLKILAADAKEIFETEVRVKVDQQEITEVRVPIPTAPEPATHGLDALASTLQLEVPQELHTFLSDREIRTLGDIRKAGGIGGIEGLPVAADHPSVQLLEAHADLARVSPDIRLNASLINQGYASVYTIANAPRTDLVGAIYEHVGDFNAAKLQVVARAQTHFLDNVVTELAANQANGFDLDQLQLTEEMAAAQRCTCRDCEAAVSPLAYLADLLKYTVKHVKNNNAVITRDTLVNTFHQPFNILPASCEAVDAQIRQVRLCVEVLRGSLGARPLADAAREADLAKAERAYRLDTYAALLTRIGTSYGELRLAQTADAPARQALADRLGIDLSHLNTLYLDPDASPEVLTEQRLEQLFGLVDTNRDPLAPSSPPELQTWRLEHLRALWRSQDFPADLYEDGPSYVTLKQIPPGVAFPPAALAAKISHDAVRQRLVFNGTMTEAERSALLAVSPDDTYERAIKQLYHNSQRLPIIDPDLIGPDDLRKPSPGNKAFDLWKKRREWVDNRLTAFSALNLEGMFTAMYQPVGYEATSIVAWASTTPVAEFTKIHTQLTQGTDAETAKFRIKDDLHMSVESFNRLMAVYVKDKAWQTDSRNEKVTEEEWQDVRSILVQAQKVKLFTTWRDEERTAGLDLDPETFWMSLLAPREGDWPPSRKAGVPLIDPDTVKLNDLPDPVVGEHAIAMWHARLARLAKIPEELQAKREAQGFEAMLRLALGHPNPGDALQHDLNSLKTDLSSSNQTVVESATRKITDDLHLTVDGFRRLLAIKAKNDTQGQANQPTAAEWNELYLLVTPARKVKHEFPTWIQEEQSPATGVVYWSALKDKLPRWRSSLESRQAWQEALRNRSQAPTIDPDLIGPGDLRDPAPGNAAFDLMQARESTIAGELAQAQAQPRTLSGLDASLQKIIGLTITQFLSVAATQEQGHPISGRLSQLTLEFDAFNSLLRVCKLAKEGQPILDSEWDDVHAIFIQTWKRRNATQWRANEKDQDVTLRPDLFQIPPPIPLTFPPPVPTPGNGWRAPRLARQAWQDKLQTRVDQEDAIANALKEAIGAVEEMHLVGLRDALILASSAPATATDAAGKLEQKAKWITENLLIDAKMSGCAMTTRIAQAIETVQGLLHALRTAQLEDVFQTFTLDLTHFDEEWKWMGSYPSWRAAMFVFLYPENILQPSLRRRQTPGLKTLLSKARSRRLTPADACREAKRYAEYFQDVCTIRIEVTCMSRTRLHRGDACSKTDSDERCLLYMFGRSENTNTVYWSAYDIQDPTGYAQTFWSPVATEVEGFDKIAQILGAIPYQVNSGERFIFLFGKKVDGETESLVCVKYDLEQQGWIRSILPLDTPGRVTRFNAVVKQTDSEGEPPHILFHVRIDDGVKTVYRERKLNTSGSGWESDDFKPLYLEHLGIPTYNIPVGMLRFRSNAFMVFVEGSGVTAYYCYPGTDKKNPPGRYVATIQAQGGLPNSMYVGAFTWPGIDGLFLLSASKINAPTTLPGIIQFPSIKYRLQFITESTTPGIIIASQELVPPFPDPPSFSLNLVFGPFFGHGHLAPTSGMTDEHAGKYKRFVYQLQGVSADEYQFLLTRVNGKPSTFLLSQRIPVLPLVKGPFDIPTELSNADLIQRRDLELEAFAANQSAPESLLTYLEEAYYCVPIALALALQRTGEYIAALDWFRTVYNYTATITARKIYPGLKNEESLMATYKRGDNWLLDPLDPHAIAYTRRNTYTRFTLLAIVRCLLDYADAEFTRDTAESNPIARRLYLAALELLETPELKQRLTNECEDIIGTLDDMAIGQDRWHSTLAVLKQDLRTIPALSQLQTTVLAVRDALQVDKPIEERFVEARAIVAAAQGHARQAPIIGDVIQNDERLRQVALRSGVAHPGVAVGLESAGSFAAQDFQRTVSLVTGISPAQLIKKSTRMAWLREPISHIVHENGTAALARVVRPDGIEIDIMSPSSLGNLAKMALSHPMTALNIASPIHDRYVPAPILGFCIPPNPILNALRMRAELNLHKLRTCRNIAGLKRALEPYAAPTDTTTGLPQLGAGGQLILPGARTLRPTLYRYGTLIERAKQLVQLAGQIEVAMLSALQRRDDAALNLLKARQELDLAQAGVRLQDLRLTESKSKVRLAELGEARAQLQADHYDKLIQDGLTNLERDAIAYLEEAVDYLDTADDLQVIAAVLYFSQLIGGAVAGGILGSVKGPMGTGAGAVGGAIAGALQNLASVGSGLSALSSAFSIRAQRQSTRSSIASMKASFERRQQEWEHQLSLARQDITIAAQQTTIANDEVHVVEQERVIADLRTSHARDTVEFLTTKQFGNVELYDWMSDVLEGVYCFFLQQATAMARLAENQLAFERQELPPAFIQTDYWNVVTDDGGPATNDRSADRRGLTGSARLLQDIFQLDQYAFETNKRKLQISKTISLAMLAPVEFQRFRETGVLTFATPMEMFDRDFPGHYLRLIKQVRASVAALIPPSQGIHAVLTTAGLSRVVIGPDVFQTVPIRRDPEFIALSSPMNSTGLFDLEPQTDMLRPFEGTGVDTIWEFRMPRAANQFDYRTIADVLMTIDYTALDSFDYRQQVIQTLNPSISSERAFSFRHYFADQWYDLHNPEQTSTPMVVRFTTVRADFPPNVDSLKVKQVVLLFSRADGLSFEVPVSSLRFTEERNNGTVGGAATSINGIISTRIGNAGSWTAMIGKAPMGEWELALPNTEEMRNRFKNEEIRDILFIITYDGRTPPWPA